MMNTVHIPFSVGLNILVGPRGAGKSSFIAWSKLENEVVSSDQIREWLTGDFQRQDHNTLVFEEFNRRIETKLRAGFRVFADATHLRNSDRRAVANIGRNLNVPVRYIVFNRSIDEKVTTGGWRNTVRSKGMSLIERHDETFRCNEKDILAGDGDKQIEVIDTRMTHVVALMPGVKPTGYAGLTVIGDIHGNLEGMSKALTEADQLNYLPLSLGDILDYGTRSLMCVTVFADRVFQNRALAIRGNHEAKQVRIMGASVIEGKTFKGKLSEGNKTTLDEFKRMRKTKSEAWARRFISLVNHMPDWLEIGDYLFVHGAAHPKMFGNSTRRARRESIEENFAMYGETTGNFTEDGMPERIYDWVDKIPDGKTVVVGHAIKEVVPSELVGALGGRAVFLDTGSSKMIKGLNVPGKLSWMHIPYDEDLLPKELEHATVRTE